MCGIVGFLDKTSNEGTTVGQTILKMLTALEVRGPDSAGVALFGPPENSGFVVRVKLGEHGDFEEKGTFIAKRVQEFGSVGEVKTTAEYLRFVIDLRGEPTSLASFIESLEDGIEVVSMGRMLEVVKQVGSPQNLEATYGVSAFLGTHGLGHTRLSTESRVDLSHSQPFWAHGYPDLAIVHNGHITNYHKMRRRYEQHGVKFYTENDSEIIGVYLAERLSQGLTLRETLDASLIDLDGSFSYLVATPDAIGFAKDPFAFKPLLFTETDTFVAVATEEIAIRSAFDGAYEVREAQAKDVRIWQR
ncbi:MAG: glutamine phosphoribosylpyrophosphate amidotransferase [Candidatus Poribacteria bacterium]|nr:glutamine phosphoribosylpyrophosphate amidotransferase [Candidatus Poribacteria bacterium]